MSEPRCCAGGFASLKLDREDDGRIIADLHVMAYGDTEDTAKRNAIHIAQDHAPDPSVPLSAIRALVQQWRDQDADDARTRGYLEAWNTYHVCANDLAALCPAPTEETERPAL